MMAGGAIPFVTIEEHHEAFCLWHAAVSRGWIPANGNTLLHVDEHSDLRLPVLRRPPLPFDSLDEAARFTYEELGIGNFIWPAVLLGIVSRMVWMRSVAPSAEPVRLASVWIEDGPDVALRIGWHKPTERNALPDDAPRLLFSCPKAGEIEPLPMPYVLDIDLDYFASYPRARGRFEIAITPDAYREFNRDPYHFLRLSCWDKVTAYRRNGGCFLRFGDDRPESPARFTPDVLDQRFEWLRQFVAAQAHRPALVTVCRSVKSGYTPPELVASLERRVADMLAVLFDLRPVDRGELIPAASQEFPDVVLLTD